MSVIFGVYNLNGERDPLSYLTRMNEKMASVKPDIKEVWTEKAIGLGQFMFFNTPESIHETIPLKNKNETLVLIYTGRIDNREELFDLLEINFQERYNLTDNNLIMKSYEKWGLDCPDHILGDWSFAIWNKTKKELFIARDHHGNTGIYYYLTPGFFCFSTLIKGLFALPEVPRQPNEYRIAQKLLLWKDEGENTNYENIYRLPPAHAMLISPGKFKLWQYYTVRKDIELKCKNDNEYVESFLEIYKEAVRCRLRSHKKVGITLSGGLDSGSVSALAAQYYNKTNDHLLAFSSIPLHNPDCLDRANSFGNEAPYIESIRHHIKNIDVTYIKAEDISPINAIYKLLDITDEVPLISTNYYWILSLLNKCRERDLGVLLTGQGGNNTISPTGEDILIELILKGKWIKFYGELKKLKSGKNFTVARYLKQIIVKPLIVAPILLNFPGLNVRGMVSPWYKFNIINPELDKKYGMKKLKQKTWLKRVSLSRNPRERRLDFLGPGKSVLGSTWQSMGSAYGIEVRDPTFDKRIIDFCFSIPNDQYYRDGVDRRLIRRAMEGYLPEKVLWNKMRGRQSADFPWRMRACKGEIESLFSDIEKNELVNHFLNIPALKEMFNHLIHTNNPDSCEIASSALHQGLYVGAFLQRF